MRSLPDSLLQPLLQRLRLEKVQRQNGEQVTAKQFFFNCDPALRSVVAKEALQWRKGNVTQVITQEIFVTFEGIFAKRYAFPLFLSSFFFPFFSLIQLGKRFMRFMRIKDVYAIREYASEYIEHREHLSHWRISHVSHVSFVHI